MKKTINPKFVVSLVAILSLFGCSGEADESKRLGFASVDEMKQAHANGWHTQQQYYKDNPTIARKAEERLAVEKKRNAEKRAADEEKETKKSVVALDDSDREWYGEDSLTHGCKKTDGPGEMIKTMQVLGEAYKAIDVEKSGGDPVVVTLEIRSRGASITYYRGEKRCEAKLGAKLGAKSAEVDKYR